MTTEDTDEFFEDPELSNLDDDNDDSDDSSTPKKQTYSEYAAERLKLEKEMRK